MKTKCKNGNTVDHWYDRKIRSSVTQIIDASGKQIGEAQFSGNRKTAKFTRESAINENGGRAK